MASLNLAKGTKVELGQRDFQVIRRLNDDVMQLEASDDGELCNLERTELQALIADGKARIPAVDGKDYPEINTDLSFLSDEDREATLRRYAYVRQVDEERGHLSGRLLVEHSIEVCAKRRNDPRPPTWQTVYGWRKRYCEADGDLRSLIPRIRNRGNRTRRLDQFVLNIVKNVIDERYLTRECPGVSDVYPTVVHWVARANEMRGAHEQLPIPSDRILYKEVKKLDPYEFNLRRYGKRVAELEASSVGPGVKSNWPLERVEIDHTVLDIMVCDDRYGQPIGRPTFTILLDHFSRMPLGYYIGFDPPCVEAVMMAIRSAIVPKDWLSERFPEIENDWPCWGVPETLVTDNGREFHSQDLELACAQLGIHIHHTPAKAPWTKGVVERFIHTVNHRLIAKLPGKTFHNIQARGEYKPVEEASITYSELNAFFCKWVADIYGPDEHKGIGDIPVHRWAEAIKEHPPRLFGDSMDLSALLYHKHDERVVQRTGIVYEHLHYNNDRLQRLRNSRRCQVRVEIKVNPSDIGRIVIADKKSGAAFEVPAVDQDYAEGLRLWQHKKVLEVVRDRNRGRVDRISIARAVEHLSQVADKAVRSPRPSKKVGRFNQRDTAPGRDGPLRLADPETSHEPESVFQQDSIDYDQEHSWIDDPLYEGSDESEPPTDEETD